MDWITFLFEGAVGALIVGVIILVVQHLLSNWNRARLRESERRQINADSARALLQEMTRILTELRGSFPPSVEEGVHESPPADLPMAAYLGLRNSGRIIQFDGVTTAAVTQFYEGVARINSLVEDLRAEIKEHSHERIQPEAQFGELWERILTEKDACLADIEKASAQLRMIASDWQWL
jgi:hypothetical protein